MLGHSVSYFLSQYWRNVPLYAEKLIPLLDNCLSNNFVYSDKVSGAFYELTNKYQNTAELPLENLKEFIREQGYGYILDLMIQDEENIKLLWYLLVLIHQLKGSREGLELVLGMFQSIYDPERISQLETLGAPTVTATGNFVAGKGPNLLLNKLNVSGACLNGSNGTIIYTLPEGSYINEAGIYKLSFTNTSFESMGKLNSIKVTARHLNTDVTTLYEENRIIYNYPAKTHSGEFTFVEGESPIYEIAIEIDCDFYNKLGACLSGFKITKEGTTYLPISGGVVQTTDSFFEEYEVEKLFEPFNIQSTMPTNAGSISVLYPNSLSAGNYVLGISILGGTELINYINDIKVAIRYEDWDSKDADSDNNTLNVLSLSDLNYIYVRDQIFVDFRATKPFNQIYISYEPKDQGIITASSKIILSDLGIYKNSTEIVVKTIPNMTSKATPSGSVVTNAEFASNGDAFKLFNYTSPVGATPTMDGYIKYDYEVNERPPAGDYTFTWANSSTNNNAYIKSFDAYITYIDGTQLQIDAQPELEPVIGKTKYYYKFTATNTIKSVTINYTCQYNDEGIGGTFSEANITKIKEVTGGSSIDVWYESLPVAEENTFNINTEVDIAQTGSEFFDNFKNFVRNYVYPELQTLKVKYSLEGVQTPRIYSVSKILYTSTLDDETT